METKHIVWGVAIVAVAVGGYYWWDKNRAKPIPTTQTKPVPIPTSFGNSPTFPPPPGMAPPPPVTQVQYSAPTDAAFAPAYFQATPVDRNPR